MGKSALARKKGTTNWWHQESERGGNFCIFGVVLAFLMLSSWSLAHGDFLPTLVPIHLLYISLWYSSVLHELFSVTSFDNKTWTIPRGHRDGPCFTLRVTPFDFCLLLFLCQTSWTSQFLPSLACLQSCVYKLTISIACSLMYRIAHFCNKPHPVWLPSGPI